MMIEPMDDADVTAAAAADAAADPEPMDTSSSENAAMVPESHVVTTQPASITPLPSNQSDHGQNQHQFTKLTGPEGQQLHNFNMAASYQPDLYTAVPDVPQFTKLTGPEGQQLHNFNMAASYQPDLYTAVPDVPQAQIKPGEEPQRTTPAAANANHNKASTSAPESSHTMSKKHAGNQTKVTDARTEPQASAPRDDAVVHVTVDGSEELPDKWKYNLQTALQTWCNNKDKGASVTVIDFLDNGRTAVVKITPSTVLNDLKTLYLKKVNKLVNVQVREAEPKPERQSASQTESKKVRDKETPNQKDVGAPVNVPGDDGVTKASAPLTVPPLQYCYLIQVHQQEVKAIEKKFGVKITAETCISFSAENNSTDSISRASDAFTELYQKTAGVLKPISIPHTHMESDIMKETLRNISTEENKIMLIMSANENLLFGPQDLAKMVSKRLTTDDGAGVKSSSSHSMATSRSDGEPTHTSLSLDIVNMDAPTRLQMEDVHWKLLKAAFQEQIAEIQNKYGVKFLPESDCGLITVSALPTGTHQINLEAHAFSALTHLYLKVVTSAITWDQTDDLFSPITSKIFNTVLAQHPRVLGELTNNTCKLFGLPMHLVPAVTAIEKRIGRPVFDEKVRKMLDIPRDSSQASGFQSRRMEMDSTSGAHSNDHRDGAEVSGSNQKFLDKVKEKDKEEKCPICLDTFTDQKKLDCGHVFCKACLHQSIESTGKICPVCKQIFGTLTGNQPDGMMWHYTTSTHLPGYERCGTITIQYKIPSGVQTKAHPNPGQRYSGTSRTAFLPDNAEGNRVLSLLRRAFDQKLIFTVGRSTTTGADNMVIWNDIHHKTTEYGGPASYGYPDPDYLDRVKAELKAKGVE